MKYKYQIIGMHCPSCIEKIRAQLAPQYKIVSATFNPPELVIESNGPVDLNSINLQLQTLGYRLQILNETHHDAGLEQSSTGISAYYPIFLIAAYILGVATLSSFSQGSIDWHKWMNLFMAGFFLVFSAFKFLDLKGFAEGYSTYDLLAKRWHAYGFIYPFLELCLGILYLTETQLFYTNLATVVIMGFSSIGVINSLLRKQQFQCACLGTILKVPLSIVTLVEDLTMVVLAAISLFI